MALHLTPAQHAQDSPDKWTVRKADKHGKRWNLCSSLGDGSGVLDTFTTKKDAEQAKSKGRVFDLYQKEGRWFNGEHVPTWKPYAACKPDMDKAARA